MRVPGHVLVVGAGIAGFTVVDELRRQGFPGILTLVGEEEEDPYDRPALSKQVLSRAWAPARSTIATRQTLEGLGVDLILGAPAVSLDIGRRSVTMGDGREICADEIVIATGSHAVVPPWAPLGPRVQVLRTLHDSLSLSQTLGKCRQLAIIGSGVLGLEVAATAKTLGVSDVTVLGTSEPMQHVLGQAVSARLRAAHEEQGVRFELGEKVIAVSASPGRSQRQLRVHRREGHTKADTVVIAVGARASVGWLAASRLPIGRDGVLVDRRGRVVPGIHAAGEVCAWPDPGGQLRRVEHRTTAAEQARAVAWDLLGGDVSYEMIPFWWSDQYGLRLQGYGTTGGGREEFIIAGTLAGSSFAVAYGDGRRVTGVVGLNAAKATRTARELVSSGHAWPPHISQARDVNRA